MKYLHTFDYIDNATHRYLHEGPVVDGGVGVERHHGHTPVLDQDRSLDGRHGGRGVVAQRGWQRLQVRLVVVLVVVIEVVVVVYDGVNGGLAGPRGATVYPRVPSVLRGVSAVPSGAF